LFPAALVVVAIAIPFACHCSDNAPSGSAPGDGVTTLPEVRASRASPTFGPANELAGMNAQNVMEAGVEGITPSG
jgi:hypothetical protein